MKSSLPKEIFSPGCIFSVSSLKLKILRVQPDANKIYLLVRGKDASSAKQRVQEEVITSFSMHFPLALQRLLTVNSSTCSPHSGQAEAEGVLQF
jgi:hypothetical protein